MPSTPDNRRQGLTIVKPEARPVSSFTLPTEAPVIDSDPTLTIPQGHPDTWPDRPLPDVMAPVVEGPKKVEHIGAPVATLQTEGPTPKLPAEAATVAPAPPIQTAEAKRLQDNTAASNGEVQPAPPITEPLAQIFATENTPPQATLEPLQPLQQPSPEMSAQAQVAPTAVSSMPAQPLESIFNRPLPEPQALSSPVDPELNLPARPVLAAPAEVPHASAETARPETERIPLEPLNLNRPPAADGVAVQPLNQTGAEASANEIEVGESTNEPISTSPAKPTPWSTFKNVLPFNKGKHDDVTQWNKKQGGRQQEQDNLEQAA